MLGCLALLLLAVPAAPAGAHGGSGELAVRSADADGREVRVDLDVTYEGDGEPAERALLTATPVGPGGRRLRPVELERRAPGRYELRTSVDADGDWRFLISSRFPPGSIEVAVPVGSEDGDDGPWYSSFGADWYPMLGAAAIAVGLLIIGLAVREHQRRLREQEAGTGD